MHSIHKSIVTDEEMRPIAVQISYSDWMEIERTLNLHAQEEKPLDPSIYAGVLSLTEDPLAFQSHVRGEWR